MPGLVKGQMMDRPMLENGLFIVALQAIWQRYSERWQVYNQARTVASGVTLAVAGWGMYLIGRS